jgi:hypothetical protein
VVGHPLKTKASFDAGGKSFVIVCVKVALTKTSDCRVFVELDVELVEMMVIFHNPVVQLIGSGSNRVRLAKGGG